MAFYSEYNSSKGCANGDVSRFPSHGKDCFSRQASWASTCLPTDAAITVHPSEVEEALINAVANSDFCVSVADPRAVSSPLMVSNGFSDMTGFTAKSIVGSNFRALKVGADNDPSDLMRLRSACSTGESVTVTLTNRRISGELFRTLLHLRSLSLAQDLVTGEDVWYTLGFYLDITESEIEESNEGCHARHNAEIDRMATLIRARVMEELAAVLDNEPAVGKGFAATAPAELALTSPCWRQADCRMAFESHRSPLRTTYRSLLGRTSERMTSNTDEPRKRGMSSKKAQSEGCRPAVRMGSKEMAQKFAAVSAASSCVVAVGFALRFAGGAQQARFTSA